jgi:hypothetical protein
VKRTPHQSLDVQRDGLPAAGEDHVRRGGRRLQAGIDQRPGDVDAAGVGAEPVIGDDEHGGRRHQAEPLDRRQHRGDLAVVVSQRLARGRRAHAAVVLGVIGLRQPVDHDRRPELRQHVFAQDTLAPGHRRVVGIGAAALGRRPTELRENGGVHVGRPGHGLTGLEITVDQHPHARRRPRIGQQRAARRARADGDQPQAVSLQPLGERAAEHEPTAGGAIEHQQAPVIVGTECARRLDRGRVHLVAEDPHGARLHAGDQRRGVHAGDGRKHGVAIRELHAFGA